MHLDEKHNTNSKNNVHKHKTVYQPPPTGKAATAERSEYNCLDNRDGVVEAHKFIHRDAELKHALGLARLPNKKKDWRTAQLAHGCRLKNRCR